MKKITCLIFMWLFCTIMPAFAETEEVSSDINKFGGMTKSVTCFNNDQCYNDGMQQIIYHYDNLGKEKLIEIYQNSDYLEKTGSHKTLIYYKKNSKIIEILCTDIEAGEKGYSKIILYLSESNKLIKREYYFTEKSPIAMLGIYKRVIYYNNDGQINKVIHLDKVGNIAVVK